jgi:hypothetical protein
VYCDWGSLIANQNFKKSSTALPTSHSRHVSRWRDAATENQKRNHNPMTPDERIQLLEETTTEIIDAIEAELKTNASETPQLLGILDTLLQIFSARRQSEREYPGNRSDLWHQQTAKLEEGIRGISAVIEAKLVLKYSTARASIRERAYAAADDDDKLRELRREGKSLQAELSEEIRRLGPLATDALRELEYGLGADADAIMRVLNTRPEHRDPADWWKEPEQWRSRRLHIETRWLFIVIHVTPATLSGNAWLNAQSDVHVRGARAVL